MLKISSRKLRVSEIALILTPLLVVACVILAGSLSLRAPQFSVSYAMLQFSIVMCIAVALVLAMNCWEFHKQ
jgi:hypothetical protein